MPREVSIEKIQGYFDAIDVNKWLLFNAMNEEQVIKAKNFEKHVLNVVNDLIAPLPIVN